MSGRPVQDVYEPDCNTLMLINTQHPVIQRLRRQVSWLQCCNFMQATVCYEMVTSRFLQHLLERPRLAC